MIREFFYDLCDLAWLTNLLSVALRLGCQFSPETAAATTTAAAAAATESAEQGGWSEYSRQRTKIIHVSQSYFALRRTEACNPPQGDHRHQPVLWWRGLDFAYWRWTESI